MSDLFKSFIFDIQRFASKSIDISKVSIDKSGGDSAKFKAGDYWGINDGTSFANAVITGSGTMVATAGASTTYNAKKQKVKQTFWSAPTKVTLTKGKVTIAGASVADTGLKIYGLDKAKDLAITEAAGGSTVNIKFTGANAKNDYVFYNNSGGISSIQLKTSGATFTVSQKQIASNAWAFAEGYKVNDATNGISVADTGFTFTKGKKDSLNSLTIDSNEATINDAGAAKFVLPGDKKVKTLIFGTDEFNFTTAGGLAFGVSGAAVTSVNFSKQGDALALAGGASLLAAGGSFTYGSKYSAFANGLSIAVTADTEAVLKLTNNASAFELSNLVGEEGIKLNNKDNKKVSFLSDYNGEEVTGGGAIGFDAAKGTLTSVTAEMGAVVGLSGFTKKDTYSINGQKINIEAIDDEKADDKGIVKYAYLDKNEIILDVTGLSSATTFKSSQLGNATQLNIGTTLQSAEISGTTFKLVNKGLSSAFVLDGKSKATGFIFDAYAKEGTSSSTIIFEKGVPSNFNFYESDPTDDPIEDLPTITGTGGVAVGMSGAGNYNVVVGQGLKLEYANGTKIDFSGLTKDEFAKVVAEDGAVQAIGGAVAAEDDGIADVVETDTFEGFQPGAKIVVTGAKATDASEGIKFGNVSPNEDPSAENAIALASGNFTYEVGTDDDSTKSLTLTDASDTIYGIADVAQVKLGGKEGTITDAIDGDEKELKYKTGGNAYFAASGDGSLTGFAFWDVGDALTFTGELEEGFQALYYDKAIKAVAEEGAVLPTVVQDAEKTVTMIQQANGEKKLAQFEVSGLSADAVVGFEDTGSLTFGADGGTALFGATGAAIGFTAKEGKVSLDSGIAALLAPADEEAELFTINGVGVNITTTAEELVYDADENGLLGLDDGSAIVDAGNLEKIYASNADSTEGAAFTFGEEDVAVTYTAYAAGDAEEGTLAYFAVKDGAVTGFVFGAEDDFVVLDADSDEKFTLQDGADGEAFTAPIVWVDDTMSERATTKIVKGEENFQIIELEQDNYVVFDNGTTLTYQAVNGEEAGFAFNDKGELVGVLGIEEDGDAVKVDGATTAILFGEDEEDGEYVEITGEKASFVYEIEDGDPTIKEVYANSTIKQVAGATKVYSASGANGEGDFTFGASAAAQVFTVEGEDANGIIFELEEGTVNVSGISDVDAGASVKGAFFTDGDFDFNGETTELTAGNSKAEYTFSGTSLFGLNDGDEVATAGGISTFITAEEGKFTIIDSEVAIKGDESVSFAVADEALTAIDDLAAGASAIGTFEEIAVNGQSIAITGDVGTKFVVGAESGIAKIGGLSGDVVLTAIGNATQLGADGDGNFTFDFASGNTYGLSGNAEIETTITLGEVLKVAGLDEGEAITGSFSKAIEVEEKLVQITGDDEITVVNGASGVLTIENLSGGASIAYADDIYSATTDGEGDFTFADGRKVNVAGDEEVEFELDGKGNLVGINDVDADATLTGDLNGLVINGKEPDIVVMGISGLNTNLTYEDGILSGVVDGDTVISADNVSIVRTSGDGEFTFGNGSFSVAGDADGVDFVLQVGTVSVASVEGLDDGATLKGDLGALTAINGASVIIKNDPEFAVVGATDGIKTILDLSDGAEVVYAGGAESAITDTEGTFNFAGGQSFVTSLDAEVSFLLDGETVTGVAGLSGIVKGNLKDVTVNGETIDIVGDSDDFLGAAGTLDESAIAAVGNVGGSAVTINEVGSASALLTDAAGVYTFTKSSQVFDTDDEELVFLLNKGEEVTEILGLEKSVTGSFTDIKAVNGVSFAVADADDVLTIVGKEDLKGISEIAGVTGDATIDDVGGASFVSTDSDGVFTFAGHSNPFTIAGDSAVTFEMVEGEKALVKGVTGFGDEGPATITGELGKVSVDGIDIDIEGDADEMFSFAKDGDNAVLGEVGGDEVVINGIGGASLVQVVQDGSYTFGSTYVLDGGNSSVIFGASSVENLTGTIEGKFDSATVNGKKIAIAGDSEIGLVGGDSGVALIYDLSDGAVINAADDVFAATTDGDGTFTFADGREIGIAGSASGVAFELDGKGNLVGIDGVDENTTVTGDLNGLAFGGDSAKIDVRDNVKLWYNNGTLSGVVAGDTVVSADGATLVVAEASDGEYVFGSGSDAQSFQLIGDSGIIAFEVEDGNKVVGISELDPGAMIEGKLNGITINGESGIDIVGDTDDVFGVMAGVDGNIAAVGGVGGESVKINNVGSASFVFTEGTIGEYTFTKSGQTFDVITDVGGEKPGIGFKLADDAVVEIGGLSGLVRGDFEEEIKVNGQPVQVIGDEDGVIVAGDDDGLLMLGDVDDGATVKAWGDAKFIDSDGTGEYTFDNGDFAAQTFEVGGDSGVAFLMTSGMSGADVAVAGVSGLRNGTLKFDTATTEIIVNPGFNNLLTFDTTEDVTLTIVNKKIVGLSGITGGVSGVEDASIAATGPITVNGDFIDITDSNNSFNVFVAGGGVSEITDVTGDATVNVTNGKIVADGDGTFLIGGEEFTFTDDDDDFGFGTDENQKLIGVGSLSGSVEFASPSAAIMINGDLFAIESASTSDPAVKVLTNGEDITAVEGLESGDSVNGALDKAQMTIAGTSATTKGEGQFLTINGKPYELLGDADGITLDGSNHVIGLDENASLVVGEGSYTVNGTSEDLQFGAEGGTIVGDDEGKSAYAYDPEHLLVRKGTPIEEIERMLGLPNYDTATWGGDDYTHESGDPSQYPLTKEQSDALLDPENGENLDQPGRLYADNTDNKETQELDLSEPEFAKKFTLYGGPQSLETNDEFGNMSVVDKQSSGEKEIELGDGGNAAVIDESAAIDNAVDITGGAGNDSVFVRGDVSVTFDLTEGGADLIITWGGANARVKLEGYDYNTGAGIKIDERKAKDIAQAIADGLIQLGDGVVSIVSSSGTSIIDIGTQLGGALVNLYNYKGEKQVVAFTNNDGGEAGDANSTEDTIYIGNYNGKKTGGSKFTGGAGNDTAFLGGGDQADLGDGNNTAYLQDNPNRASATLNLTKGHTDIYNANNTLDENHGDVMNVDLTQTDVEFDGTDLTFKGPDFSATIHDADKDGELDYSSSSSSSSSSSDLASSADEAIAELEATPEKYTNQIINSNGSIWRGSFGAEGSVMQVKADEDIRANFYKATNGGVTFEGYSGDAVVDLANDGEWVANSSIDGRDAVFAGIVSLRSGSADSHDQFKGSDNNETLMGGEGYASLYGDGGNNMLVGYNGEDKEGQTTFMVLGNANGAANTLANFEFVTDDNYTDTEKVTADILEVDLNTNHVERIEISNGTDVLVEVKNNSNDTTEKALILNAVGKDIAMSDLRDDGRSSLVAQVNTDKLTFDKYATYYYATEKNATLTVDDAAIQDEAIVYLDGSKGIEFIGDFRVIDATGFSGKAELAGSVGMDNTIYAGSGDTSLWGGATGEGAGQVGNDVLYGGAGQDVFFYKYGNGADTVYAGEGDVINLAVTLDDIDSTSIEDEKVVVNFKDGGSVTVNDGGSNVAYQVQGDGDSIYLVDRENGKWVKKA